MPCGRPKTLPGAGVAGVHSMRPKTTVPVLDGATFKRRGAFVHEHLSQRDAASLSPNASASTGIACSRDTPSIWSTSTAPRNRASSGRPALDRAWKACGSDLSQHRPPIVEASVVAVHHAAEGLRKDVAAPPMPTVLILRGQWPSHIRGAACPREVPGHEHGEHPPNRTLRSPSSRRAESKSSAHPRSRIETTPGLGRPSMIAFMRAPMRSVASATATPWWRM